jgi:hypothetical protein
LVSRTAAAILAALALLVASGCGDSGSGDDGGSTASTATTTGPSTTTAPPATATTGPEDQPGGAGDQAGTIVRATFTFADGGVTPAQVAVPAFFKIRVTGVSQDGKPHTISFQGGHADVPAGGHASFKVEGLKAGRYPVTIDGSSGAATIVSGATGGP